MTRINKAEPDGVSVKVCVETYGCTMNQGEGLDLERLISGLGYQLVPDCEEAEVAVINTCVVIRSTELKMLRRMRHLRDSGKRLVVTGCMASVMRESVLDEFPDALVVAPLDYDEFHDLFRGRFGTGSFVPVQDEGRKVTAIIPIAQGCLGSCSYCITKLARGTLDSYPPGSVVASVRRAVEAGSAEVLLTAQDTGCYGFDIGTDLAALLGKVASVPGEFRVRVGMMNPDSLRDIIAPLARAYQDPKVYKFLHLPVQTGSDRLLRSMGRGYSAAEFEGLVARFRQAVPRLTLSTDVIAGFPGEGDGDHQATKDLISKVRPNIVNVTRFSSRPGTEAAEIEGQVVSRIAKDRSRELAKLRFAVAAELNRAREGEEVGALVTEKGKEGTMIARDDSYVPIVLREDLALGARVKVELTGSTATHLCGRVLFSSGPGQGWVF